MAGPSSSLAFDGDQRYADSTACRLYDRGKEIMHRAITRNQDVSHRWGEASTSAIGPDATIEP